MRHIVRATAIDMGDEPPTEFRVFKAGENPMTKGTFLFTPESAARVMADYRQCGVDMIVDLEHEALASGEVAARSDARDARAHFKLEVRAGELWAVDVKWSPDGARRLAEKTQRYISPAFTVDKDTNEITSLINCALVSMPATHGAPALVAASKRAISDSEAVACGVALARRLRASKQRVTLGVKP